MTDIRTAYDEYSIDEIIDVCIDRGMMVSPDILDDREALLSLLHHDVNDFYARERATEKILLQKGTSHHQEENMQQSSTIHGAGITSVGVTSTADGVSINGNSQQSQRVDTRHYSEGDITEKLKGKNTISSSNSISSSINSSTAESSTIPAAIMHSALDNHFTNNSIISDENTISTKSSSTNDDRDEQRELQRLERLRNERDQKVKPIKNYTKPARKRGYTDFVKFFNKRYQAIAAILKARKELQSVTSISRVIGKQERENVAIIAMVSEKTESKAKHIILKVEDPTGQTEVWLSNNKRELLEIGKEIVLDEVIGIVGQTAGNRIFATDIIFPDIPLSKELKKGPMEKYAVFVGDVHIGAKLFLKDEFEKFLMWLSGNFGTAEQREIASKVEYVIFTGDLVEGVGIYPEQDQDLNIVDINAQYDAFTRYIKMVPEHMQVVLIAGNHDAGRLQEPQLPIYKDFCEDLYALPNVTILSNPSMFTIDQSAIHPGFDVLLYHGYSLIYYANNVQTIRDAGGQKATEKIMKLLLQKRHLAPTHGSNTYVPDAEEDPLVIDKVPDFFITGHVHRVSYANYRGVTVMNASCWSEVSEEQEKRGLEPQPARLPIVNLKTRDLRIMNFYHGSEAKKLAMQANAEGK